jgi:aspartyl protease family protein
MAGSSYLAGAIALAGLVLVGAQLRAGEAPAGPGSNPAGTAVPDRGPVSSAEPGLVSGGGISLKRAGDSHFYALAQVNGAPVRFLIDTGSSSVVLTPQDALRAGIGAGDYAARGVGAGGEVRLMPTTLARLALGPVAADNVPAMVAEDGKIPVSLLGQSFLARAGSVTIAGDTLILR